MLMDWCKTCEGRGTEEWLDSTGGVYTTECPTCEGSGLVRDTDDSAFERRTPRQKNAISDESR